MKENAAESKQTAKKAIWLSKRQFSEINSMLMADLHGLSDGRIRTRPQINPAGDIVRQARLNRQREQQAKVNADLAVLARKVDTRSLFLFTYVPLSIAELVWDYAETVCDCAEIHNRLATARLNKAMRRLAAGYRRAHAGILDAEHHCQEQRNALRFEKYIRKHLGLATVNIRASVNAAYPYLDDTGKDLLTAVYQCLTLGRAVESYTSKKRVEMQKLFPSKNVSRVLPDEFYAMLRLLPEYVGDKPLSPVLSQTLKKFSEVFEAKMSAVKLTREPIND